MKRNDAFPGKWLKKEDILGPTILSIAKVELADVGMDGQPEMKPAMWFEQDVTPMILNSSNWDTLEELYGDDSDMWKSKQIAVYVDPDVRFGNKKVGGLRLRGVNAPAAPATNGPKIGSDAVSQFWAFVGPNGLDGKTILANCGGDFVKALEAAQAAAQA